jgi:hypothetical protein
MGERGAQAQAQTRTRRHRTRLTRVTDSAQLSGFPFTPQTPPRRHQPRTQVVPWDADEDIQRTVEREVERQVAWVAIEDNDDDDWGTGMKTKTWS